MKSVSLGLAFALLMLAGVAHAAPQGCGYEPKLNYSDKSAASKLLMASTDINASSDTRACADYTLGTLYAFTGDNQKAILYYRKAIGWYASYADALEGEGDAEMTLGEPDKARQAYADATSAGADTPDGLGNRCWTRAIRGQALDRTVADCTRALTDRPDHWDILRARALAYYRLGKFDEAVADSTAALAYRQRNADALYIRGLAELAKGDASTGNADLAAAKDADYRIADTFALYGVRPSS